MRKIINGLFSTLLIKFIFLIPLFSFSQAATLSDLDVEKTTRRIYGKITKVADRIPDLEGGATLIIGNVGSGKSCLLNYIAEKRLIAKEGKFGGQMEIVLEPGEEGFDMSPGMRPETGFPNFWKSYGDCPGFFEIRPEYEILNAFTIANVIKKSARRVRFLVAIPESVFTEPRPWLVDIVNTLGKIFHEEALIRGLGLIVTKNKNQTLKSIRTGITSLLKEEGKGKDDDTPLNPGGKRILTYLSSPSCQVAFFDMPKEAGKVLPDNRAYIIDAVKKTPFLDRPTIRITVSDTAEVFMRKLLDQFNNDVLNIVKSEFYSKNIRYLEHLVSSHQELVEDLRTRKLGGLSEKLTRTLKNSDFNQLLTVVSEFPGDNTILSTKISSFTYILEFFNWVNTNQLLTSPLTIKLDWQPIIHQSISDVNILKALPEREPVVAGDLTLKGLVIGMSDVNKAMAEAKLAKQKISAINVYSLYTLIVEEDFQGADVNLTLISPEWRVPGFRHIELTGEKGSDHQGSVGITQASGASGLPGKPGNPGRSGGHLYMKGGNVFNLSKLTINVSGGVGGRGQDGGPGADGRDGGLGGLRDVEGKLENKRKRREIIHPNGVLGKGFRFLFVACNTQFKDTYESYEPGERGGDGGKGGKGGLGGDPGSVVAYALHQAGAEIVGFKEKVATKGHLGRDGSAGEPGQGGRGGPVYMGVDINEVMFAGPRGYKPTGLGPIGSGAAKTIGTGATTVAAEGAAGGLAAGIAKESAQEGIKAFFKEGLQSVAKGGITAGRIGTNLGIGAALQLGGSALSAYLSSGWEPGDPHKTDRYGPRASHGDKLNDIYNADGIQNPVPVASITMSTQDTAYNLFLRQRRAIDGRFIKEFGAIRSAL